MDYNLETTQLLIKKLTPIYVKEYGASDDIPMLVTTVANSANRVGATNDLLNRIDSNTTCEEVRQYIKDVENRNKEKSKEETKQKAKKIMIIGAIVIVALVVIFLFK